MVANNMRNRSCPIIHMVSFVHCTLLLRSTQLYHYCAVHHNIILCMVKCVAMSDWKLAPTKIQWDHVQLTGGTYYSNNTSIQRRGLLDCLIFALRWPLICGPFFEVAFIVCRPLKEKRYRVRSVLYTLGRHQLTFHNLNIETLD